MFFTSENKATIDMGKKLIHFWMTIRQYVLGPMFVGIALGVGLSFGRSLFLRTRRFLEQH